MATTGTPETIQNKTARHTHAMNRACLNAVPVILNTPNNPLLPHWDAYLKHSQELLELQRCQIQLLEALCRNQQARAEARS